MTIDTAFTHFPSLTTNRLQLRQIQPSDAEALFIPFSDAETMQYYGDEPQQSIDETLAMIEQIQTNYDRHEAIRWGITLKDADTVIGSCTLFHFDEGFHRGETGYELTRAFWGQGIMAEALSAILTYSFAQLSLHRIEALIDIANERSKNLLLKIGFTYEGYLRQRYFLGDHFEDEHYFSLLKNEWHPST